MNEQTSERSTSSKEWLRIPNGTKVRHRLEGYEGNVDGLTELVDKGTFLNPDGRTQYRIDVGDPQRKLAAEDELLIVSDNEGLMIIGKQKVAYRREVTQWFRSRFAADKFVD